MDHILAAPFGGRRLSVAMLAGQAAAEACPPAERADKWRALRDLGECRTAFGLSDRAVTVLSALISFHPGDQMTAEDDLVVYPSNRELCRRAHGISEPTLRRCLAQLVDATLIVRKDSPNGKRYARRHADGSVERAFGFDLRALLARAGDIMRMAEAIRADRRRLMALREEVTLLRRAVRKAIELAEELGLAGLAERSLERFLPYAASSNRGLSTEALELHRFELGMIMAELDKHLTPQGKSSEASGNDDQDERHKQDSNQTPILDSERFENEARPAAATGPAPETLIETGRPVRPDPRGTPDSPGRTPDPADRAGLADGERLHLGAIVKACPDIAGFALHGIASWADLLEAVERARPALGISPDAWRQAVEAMGESGAAVTVATILQRVDAIRSPGGYLRSLTDRARGGRFTPAPVVFSLLRQVT